MTLRTINAIRSTLPIGFIGSRDRCGEKSGQDHPSQIDYTPVDREMRPKDWAMMDHVPMRRRILGVLNPHSSLKIIEKTIGHSLLNGLMKSGEADPLPGKGEFF